MSGLEAAKVGGKSKEETHDFDLALTSDKSAYRVNDLPVFTIVSAEDCHLTLISVDGTGEGTRLLPNAFQQDNFLPAGKALQFPAADAPFQFRLKDPGSEQVIAVCNATGKDADGIKGDFKTRSFTDLGNYRSFIARQIAVEGAKKVAEGKTAAAKPDITSRTAITIKVE